MRQDSRGKKTRSSPKPRVARTPRKRSKAKVQAKRLVVKKAPKRENSETRKPNKQVAEALQRQAATDEILRLISSSPGDVHPVLNAIAERAAGLCDAVFAQVLLIEGDVLRPTAAYWADVGLDKSPGPKRTWPLTRDLAIGRAALDCETLHYADVVPLLTHPGARAKQQELGFRAVLVVPLLREGGASGVIFMFRREPRPFSSEQIALVETFARQAAIENARLFNETKEALEQQTAISEILRVIASSPSDVQPMLTAVAERAAKLCEAADATIFLAEGDKLRSAARFGTATRAVEVGQVMPLTRGSVAGRATIDGTTIHLEDLAVAPEEEYPLARQMQRIMGHHTFLAAPLMREDRAIGSIVAFRLEVRPFTDKQISLLKTFADQAAIAIENVRLFNETKESLERQTATSEILRAISSSPTNVQPVFETIVANAARLCSAESAAVYRFDDEIVHFVGGYHFSAEALEAYRRRFPRSLRETDHLRRVLDGSVLNIPDVEKDPHTTSGSGDVHRARDVHSTVLVPMVREDRVIGAIGVSHRDVGAFTNERVELLKIFADQAVIAIENVRLFNETKEALERQTATSEILRVISQSPRDVQPVFDSIAASAIRLCGGSSVTVTTYDGQLLHLVALATATPEGADAVRKIYPRPASPETAASRAVFTCGVVAIPDVLEDAERDLGVRATALAGGFRSVVAVPLLHDARPIGAIAVGRPEPGPFPDKQIALLQTFADQAVIAIENVRLFTELETRTLQLTRSVGELKALGEVGQAVSSTLDLETVLATIVSRAAQLAGMDGGSIWEYDETREEFYLHATDRAPDELVEALRAMPIRKGEGALGRLAMTGEPVQIRDIAEEPDYPSRLREIGTRGGLRSVLAVPLLREDHLLGALAVNRNSPGEFAPEVIELLKTFATQSALAIQNARLFREVEQKSRELATASRHKSEFLANMSHELRTPLNAIIGFSEVLSERMFGEINEKQAEYISDILQSGQHLLSLINDILDLSKIEAGRMELDISDFDLPSAIENTLTLVRERAIRRGITLGRMVDARLGVIRADERKVKQVLLNLLSNALKFTPEGGRIDVRAAVDDGVAEVSVTDTGVGIAPEEQEAVFEEFRQVGTASKKVEGTGLGLAISRKFIELHGGRIWVQSQVGSGTTFAFTLPLR